MEIDNVLVVAAHPDDEILGVGGTIRRIANKKCNINCIILGEGLTSRGNARGETSESELLELKKSTLRAAEIIGYSNVEFLGLPDNRFDSIDLLNIIKNVTSLVDKYMPDTIFTHHYGDLNIDHRITYNAVVTACRPVGEYTTKNIICFETPSSTEWNFKSSEGIFKPNLFIDITQTIKYKLNAMHCYSTEIKDYPHPRSDKALDVIAARWGTVIGKNYAEAFEIVRSVL
jgi:LmbE family N-acetylglucosaminyl deacetylase